MSTLTTKERQQRILEQPAGHWFTCKDIVGKAAEAECHAHLLRMANARYTRASDGARLVASMLAVRFKWLLPKQKQEERP